MTMASCQIAVVETGTLVNGSMAWVKVGILFSQKVQFCPPTPAPPHPPSTDPKIPLLQSLGDQVANKCSHWQQVDSALREAFSQRLQPGCVAGWVHRDVHNTWRHLFCLLQSLCEWLGWVILRKKNIFCPRLVLRLTRSYDTMWSKAPQPFFPGSCLWRAKSRCLPPAWKSFHWDTFVLLLSSFATSLPL